MILGWETKITAWQGKKKERVPERKQAEYQRDLPFLVLFAFRWAIEGKLSGNSVLSSGCNAEMD